MTALERPYNGWVTGKALSGKAESGK